MKPKMISIDALVPYDRNPRILTDAAIRKVADSITAFGFKQPIVVDKDMVIVVGHTRREAAKLLGLDKVPVIIATDLSEQDIRRYRIADNRVAEETDWDRDLLTIELGEIGEAGLDGLGFDADELAGLMAGLTVTGGSDAPDTFKTEDPDAEQAYCCPKCKFSWSGKPK